LVLGRLLLHALQFEALDAEESRPEPFSPEAQGAVSRRRRGQEDHGQVPLPRQRQGDEIRVAELPVGRLRQRPLGQVQSTIVVT